MKKLAMAALVILASMQTARAQETISGGFIPGANTAADFTATSGARVTLVKPLESTDTLLVSETLAPVNLESAPPAPMVTAVAVPGNAVPAMPAPAKLSRPRFLYGDRDDFRWQIALGFAWERFTSSIYNASAVGTDTSVTYFLNDSVGIEGNISAVFAPTIWNGEHIKLVNYVGGPKVTFRQPRWEPWVHAMVGGTHALPQTAGHSQNGFAVVAGGGADYRLHPRFSVRLEADYLATRLFNQWQNNLMLAASAVVHF